MPKSASRKSRDDPSAVAELLEECAHRLRRQLVALLGSDEDADDVLQETYLRLFRKRKKFAKVEDPQRWLFTVARREAIRLQNRRARERKICRESLDKLAPGEDLEGRSRHRTHRLQSETNRAIDALFQLPEELCVIVGYRIFGEYTFREIAELTNLPQGTVATRYRTARARMKAWCLRKLNEDD